MFWLFQTDGEKGPEFEDLRTTGDQCLLKYMYIPRQTKCTEIAPASAARGETVLK